MDSILIGRIARSNLRGYEMSEEDKTIGWYDAFLLTFFPLVGGILFHAAMSDIEEFGIVVASGGLIIGLLAWGFSIYCIRRFFYLKEDSKTNS
jgi:uncharacterized membrane-anchored protein